MNHPPRNADDTTRVGRRTRWMATPLWTLGVLAVASVGASGQMTPAGSIEPLSSWGDYDGDGLPDLYLRQPGAADVLLRNLGDGRFEDVTGLLGLEQRSGSAAAHPSCTPAAHRRCAIGLSALAGVRTTAIPTSSQSSRSRR